MDISIERLASGRWQVVEWTENGFLVLFEGGTEASARRYLSRLLAAELGAEVASW